MFERFTSKSRYAIVAAQEEARRLDHNHIDPAHLLLGLLRDDQGNAARVLASAGLTLEAARRDVDALIGRGEQPPPGPIPFSPSAKKCLELSLREALHLSHRYIGSGHLLLGLISQGDSTTVEVLGRLGAEEDQLRARVLTELQDHPEDQDDLSYGARAEPLGLRPVTLRWQPAIPALLDRIEERLTAIERRLGMAGPGGTAQGGRGRGENVVPPS